LGGIPRNSRDRHATEAGGRMKRNTVPPATVSAVVGSVLQRLTCSGRADRGAQGRGQNGRSKRRTERQLPRCRRVLGTLIDDIGLQTSASERSGSSSIVLVPDRCYWPRRKG
jgi:hypothetical protein